MQLRRLVLVALLVILGALLLASLVNEPVEAQDGNLLTNPSFEGQYSSYVPELPSELADCRLGVCQTAQTPNGWKPWWKKERESDVNPEFKPATSDVAGNRVRSGDRAAQYFSFWSTHKAGLRQTVTVPANSLVQFSAYGFAWMTESDTDLVSDYSGTPNMRIGIDPTGGIDAYSPNIVWTEPKQVYDNYQLFSIQARAQGDKVTVFTFSNPSVNPNSPQLGFKHTDMYWDDASLTVVGAGAPVAPAPTTAGGGGGSTGPAAPLPQLGPTATPDAEGVIYAEVQPGDSIWAIAARSGITIDQILEYNDMTRDSVIRVGDRLIVGYAEVTTSTDETVEATAVVTGTVEAEGTPATEEAEPTSTPVTPEPTAEIAAAKVSGAAICLTAFDDPNQNGVMDQGEGLRAAVAFTISDGQSVVSNYVTDGAAEPFCIEGLPAGSYRVSRSASPNEVLTNPGDSAIALADGSSLSLQFGSFESEAPEATTSPAMETSEPESEDGGLLNAVIVAAVIVAILLLIALVVVILSGRRKAA